MYLDAIAAVQHLRAARVAAVVVDVDPDLLLSIAHHESRYSATEATPEVGGRVSCGVMTPEPVAACGAATMLDGYLAGARHLRGWLDACHGDQRCALTGYAGGYRLIAICRDDATRRACAVADAFLNRAAWIRKARNQRSS
jgi:soluble lytic murein transglycosylase-like protein